MSAKGSEKDAQSPDLGEQIEYRRKIRFKEERKWVQPVVHFILMEREMWLGHMHRGAGSYGC